MCFGKKAIPTTEPAGAIDELPGDSEPAPRPCTSMHGHGYSSSDSDGESSSNFVWPDYSAMVKARAEKAKDSDETNVA